MGSNLKMLRLVRKNNVNETLMECLSNNYIKKTDYGFIIKSPSGIVCPVSLDNYKNDISEKNENFIWI